jgi:RNA polymerase sigma factor (sigma-70 family)
MPKKLRRKKSAPITNLPLIQEVVLQEGERDIYPLVVREVSKVWNGSGRMGSIEYQDMIAEALLAICQGRKRYREDSPVKFSTFIFPRLRGAAQDLMRKELSYQAHYEPTQTSHLIREAGGKDGLEADVDSRKRFLQVIHLLETRLDSRLAVVLIRSYLEDMRDRDIAAELKIPVSQVSHLREQAIHEIRRALLLAGQPDH